MDSHQNQYFFGGIMPEPSSKHKEEAMALGVAAMQAASILAGVHTAKGFNMRRSSVADFPLRSEVMERILLIHTEATEMAQEIKRKWPGAKPPSEDVIWNVMKEGADTVIRTLNLMRELGGAPLIARAFAWVHANNWNRPVRYNTADQGDVA